MLIFEKISPVYYAANDTATGNVYTIRTRPKNDGWMVICNESIVGTGFGSFNDAKEVCNDIEFEALKRQDRGDFTPLDKLYF